MSIADSIQKMDREELLDLANTQGVKVHWRAKDDTLRKAILDHISAPPAQSMRHPAEKPKPVVDHNTVEDVEAMLAPIKAKSPQFVSSYNPEENTWRFQCRGAEDCGNLDIPMRVIEMKAKTVSKGRLALMCLNEHFDSTVATGKNAYTNTVLTRK